MNRVEALKPIRCLVSGAPAGQRRCVTMRIKSHFKKAKAGAIDLNYRDYESIGNGGFILTAAGYTSTWGSRILVAQCRSLRDAVAYDVAGDLLLQASLEELGVGDEVNFLRNNIDHHTGATFGCHENYLMKRQLQFNPRILGTLLSFLATRQIFTGAGRVGQRARSPSIRSPREARNDFR